MKPVVLRNFTYGVYAIGVRDGNRPSACIATSVMQISKETQGSHALVALSLNRTCYSCECIEKTGVFTVSVLSQSTPASVIGALGLVSGRNADKLESVRHKVLQEGVPVIKEHTCCWFLCRVKESVETGGQRVFLAEITAGSDESSGIPMTLDYFTDHLGGALPVRSPAYLTPEMTADRISGESFVCSVCGYVYSDPNFGFEELPPDWTCPICKMPKKAFIRKK